MTATPATSSQSKPYRRPLAPERIAAIDVGSNSIRLSVAEYDPATGLRIIDEVKDQPRLASGLAATERSTPPPWSGPSRPSGG
ncbi:MAG: hypothetical protein R2882_10315 [Gemmatimonadales bacterium]